MEVLRFELRACAPYICLSPFALGIFQTGLLIYAQAGLDHSPPTYTSQVAGMIGTCTTPSLYWLRWGWGLTHFWPGLASDCVLPISISKVARLTGVSHPD
jgi:hypothetical protein